MIILIFFILPSSNIRATFQTLLWLFSVITPFSFFFNQINKPIYKSFIKCNIVIRIRFYRTNSIRMNNNQFSPAFGSPFNRSVCWIIRFSSNICYNNQWTIHHLNSTSTIASWSLCPIHATFPTIYIITHSHIIQGMNRQSKFNFRFAYFSDA